jgi:hypothetical protein
MKILSQVTWRLRLGGELMFELVTIRSIVAKIKLGLFFGLSSISVRLSRSLGSANPLNCMEAAGLKRCGFVSHNQSRAKASDVEALPK